MQMQTRTRYFNKWFVKKIIRQKEKKICQKDINHGIAEEFCTECLKWYCSKCSKEHHSFAFNHITIKSKEKIEINALCENDNCSEKGKTEFYCPICWKNLCRKWKNEHDKNHEIIIYEEYFKDENIIKFKSNVKEASNIIKEKNSEYEIFMADIENLVKSMRDLLEKKIERNTRLLIIKIIWINDWYIWINE